jgi:hypothetical protein
MHHPAMIQNSLADDRVRELRAAGRAARSRGPDRPRRVRLRRARQRAYSTWDGREATVG